MDTREGSPRYLPELTLFGTGEGRLHALIGVVTPFRLNIEQRYKLQVFEYETDDFDDLVMVVGVDSHRRVARIVVEEVVATALRCSVRFDGDFKELADAGEQKAQLLYRGKAVESFFVAVLLDTRERAPLSYL
jgi:hypothetical protein